MIGDHMHACTCVHKKGKHLYSGLLQAWCSSNDGRDSRADKTTLLGHSFQDTKPQCPAGERTGLNTLSANLSYFKEDGSLGNNSRKRARKRTCYPNPSFLLPICRYSLKGKLDTLYLPGHQINLQEFPLSPVSNIKRRHKGTQRKI